MRHLAIKKVAYTHDDFGLEKTTSSGSNIQEDNSPFANVSAADFNFAKENKPALMRRSTMALKTTRAGGFTRSSMNLQNQRLTHSIKMAISEVLEEIEFSKE